MSEEKDYTHNERNAQPRCPKGFKMPRLIKGQAALMKGATPEQRRRFMRTMGLAQWEAKNRQRKVPLANAGTEE